MDSDLTEPVGNFSENEVYFFGEFAFETDKNILLKGATIVSLPPKTCELLGVLIKNAGRILSKDELMETVWQDVFVEESNLSHHIAALRKSLGEDKNSKNFIETIPRKGYRFVAPVTTKNNLELVITEHIEKRVIEEIAETDLIGREAETAEIKRLLRQNSTRILTLTGTGGTGKTSLARQIAEESGEDFLDGFCFVDLSAVENPSLVVPTIAKSLGIGETGEKDLFDSLKGFLREKEMLLVLDNFEQIIRAKTQISKLENASKRTKFLITSRIPLHLKKETEFQVPPLALPEDKDLTEKIIQSASVKLFVERTASVKPNFILTDENARTIGEICRKLEGLPLAIELAAPRIRLMPPSAILERLENQLKFLTSAGRDLPSRQQTIRASIAWSYDLLEADEKLFFQYLSAFSGGFLVESSEAVFDGNESKTETLDLLDSLIDKNLLTVKEQKDGLMRFRFLEPIREFALEKASENGNLETVKNKHAAHFFKLAEDAENERRKTGGLGEVLFRKLQNETDNLRAALAHFFEYDAETALKMAANLNVFWSYNSQFSEGRAVLARALRETSDTPSFHRGLAYKGAAMLAWKQGDFEEARKFYEECLKIAENLEDKLLTAIAKNGLGTIFYLHGNNQKAKEIFEEILPVVREIRDVALVTSILANLGEISRLEENFEAARSYNEEIIPYSNQSQDGLLLCGSFINIASASFCLDEIETAVSNYQSGMKLAQKLDLKPFISICLDGFAAIAAKRNDIETAKNFAAEAEEIRAAIGYELELPDKIFREKYVEKLLKIK